MRIKNQFKNFITSCVVVLFSVLIIYGIVQAGSLAPSATPAATSYTLTDIYTRLTTNAAATSSDHLFTPTTTPAATLYSLTQIYSAIPTILADKVLSGTSYLGVAGTYDVSNLTADKVATSTTFGTSSVGTLLGHLFSGTGQGITGGSQDNGGVDDRNNGGAAPTDRYETSWTACDVGNNYCGTNDAGADAKDEATGLVWSLPCNGSGCSSFSDASPATYSWDNSDVNNNFRTAYQLCTDHAGWHLPHKKQLLQAYVDGSYGNLEAVGGNNYYWSATSYSATTSHPWAIRLSNGNADWWFTATHGYYVRCVR